MTRKRWVFFLVLIVASYMIFDGSRAMVVGDYLTLSTGAYAGQLGPWASVVKVVGIEPRSTLMKLTLITYGISAIVMGIFFIRRLRWARTGLLAMAFLGLWYIPFGTIINLVLILLLANKRA